MSMTIVRNIDDKTVNLTPAENAVIEAAMREAELKKEHAYTEIGRAGKWEVKVSPTTSYGYFEHDVQGEGGGLWFEGKELSDYDGRSCLPRDVAKALIALGYIVDPINYVGEPL